MQAASFTPSPQLGDLPLTEEGHGQRLPWMAWHEYSTSTEGMGAGRFSRSPGAHSVSRRRMSSIFPRVQKCFEPEPRFPSRHGATRLLVEFFNRVSLTSMACTSKASWRAEKRISLSYKELPVRRSKDAPSGRLHLQSRHHRRVPGHEHLPGKAHL